jgi:hypothetical protein
MSIQSRTHLVTFRLSADEYAEVTRYCTAEGARSVSDFVRETILHRTSASRGRKGLLEADLITLTTELQHLDFKLKDLSDWISAITGQRDQSKAS